MKAIPEIQTSRTRLRYYVRSLIIAGSVALQQIGREPVSRYRASPPYVQIIEQSRSRFAELECVDGSVLTMELVASPGERTGAALN